MVETWKVIAGYENYEVSDQGRVRSIDRFEECNGVVRRRKGKTITPKKAGNGYLGVHLYRNGERKRFLIHRLVAEAFIPNPFGFPIINHKDENPENNSACNLEWCTYKYNSNYGTCKVRMSENHLNNNLSKTVIQYTQNGDFVKEWPSTKEIFRILGYNPGNIANVCRGLKNTSHGFIWRYASDS